MLDGDSKLTKYFYVLPKLIFVIYLLLALHNNTSDVLSFTISSPLLFAVANAIFIFTNNSKVKDKVLLIAATLFYAIIIILGLLINKYIILANLAIIFIEIFLITKFKLNSNKNITKGAILSIPVQLIFVTLSFSMYHTFLKVWIFIMFVVIISLFSLALSGFAAIRVGKKIPEYGSRHMAKRLISVILMMVWIVPFMYAYRLSDSGLTGRLDFMIYGLVLAIYPYSSMLIAIHKNQFKRMEN